MVKVLAAKPDDLSCSTRTHVVEGANQFLSVFHIKTQINSLDLIQLLTGTREGAGFLF